MMTVWPIASTSMIAVDLVSAGVMIALGLAAGWWLFRGGRHEGDSEIAARAKAAIAHIRALASDVAHDVGEHNSRVKAITTDLSAAGEGLEGSDVVLGSIERIIEANRRMQEQLNKAEEKLQKQAEEIQVHAADARTDALTKLLNRRAFDDEMNRRYAEWKRLQTPFSVAMIDVDHFKKFNDTYGHQAGDAVLRGVGRVLRDTLREMDIVCRYGGEEFAIIMPATELLAAQRGAARARTAVEGARFHHEGTELKVTASVGLAEMSLGEDVELLVKRADDALYACKEAGRNCAHYNDGERNIKITADGLAPAAQEPSPPAQEPSPPADSALQSSAAIEVETLDRLANKEVFEAELGRRVAEAHRFEVPLSLLMIHVDNYKTLSAKYGQAVGMVVLDTVAQYVEILLREMDLLARFSSGQFSVMLPGTRLEDAVAIADRVRTAVSACVIPLPGSKIQLSVSLGVAEWRGDEDTRQLIERADAALYASKAAGQNVLHIHDGDACHELAAVGAS